ncbi:unnamed protein product [Eruca vesicaria subsp. sativa]|uniref:Uncharacterized protein n=1 Tax=Eruca vesicaria subsp. sativa TaxID=29727 RepID=A0ABC8KDD5_ERUVS|nr:unnamed protein product [Eruca vesicaria subsp. sativa]
MTMKMMAVFVIVAVAFSAVGQVAAATVEAPAPSPTSDAAMFVPALFASINKIEGILGNCPRVCGNQLCDELYLEGCVGGARIPTLTIITSSSSWCYGAGP